RGRDNLQAREACKAVGLVECPLGIGIGTAVLITVDRILTCWHVFDCKFDGKEEVWVRFGHKPNGGEKSNEKPLLLDPSKIIVSHQEHDFVIASLDKLPGYEFARSNSQKPDAEDGVRIIHYSQGGPLKISPSGIIKKVSKNGQLSHSIRDVQSGAS